MAVIDVPYIHSFEGIGPRKRTVETLYGRGSLAVEIREVTAGEAPVGIRFLADAEEGERDLRWHDNQLYRVFGKKGEGVAVASLRAATERREHGSPLLRGHVHYFEARLVPPEQMRLVRQRDAGGEDCENAIRRRIADAASDLLFVDGELWIATDEPKLRLVLAAEAYVEEFQPCGADAIYAYRLDEIDAIKGWLDEQDLGVEFAVNTSFEILVPESVRAPVRETSLHLAAALLLEEMTADMSETRGLDRLKKASVPYFASYAAVRDEQQALGELLAVRLRDMDLAEVCRTAQRLRAAFAPALAELRAILAREAAMVIDAPFMRENVEFLRGRFADQMKSCLDMFDYGARALDDDAGLAAAFGP